MIVYASSNSNSNVPSLLKFTLLQPKVLMPCQLRIIFPPSMICLRWTKPSVLLLKLELKPMLRTGTLETTLIPAKILFRMLYLSRCIPTLTIHVGGCWKMRFVAMVFRAILELLSLMRIWWRLRYVTFQRCI